jgi:DNA-directed RNA polymerase specialized sigma24 family protein
MDLGALMQRIQQGDREAFATLYARYNKTVYRIAYEATGNTDESLDIVKAVFREMYQTICAKGPYLGDLYGWLDALTARQLRTRRFKAQAEGAASPPNYSGDDAEAIEERAATRLARDEEGAGYAYAQSEESPIRHSEIDDEATRRQLDDRLKDAPIVDPMFHAVPERKGRKFSMVVLTLAALGLAWVLLGLLGSLDILPQWDIGYNWFNEAMFPLF